MVESEGHAWADRGQGHTAFLIIKLGWETAQANKSESRWRSEWKKKKKKISQTKRKVKEDCQLPSSREKKRKEINWNVLKGAQEHKETIVLLIK